MTFFRTFHIQIFFQTLSGKYPAVVWEPNSTCPDGPMKNEVLIRSSLIHRSFRNLKKIFRVYVETFLHDWKYCILRVQRKNWTGIFSKQFLFLNGYRALSEFLSKFWQNFSRGLSMVQCTYPGEHFEVKVFFFQNSKNIFFSELGQKSLSFPFQKNSGNDYQKRLVLLQTNTCNEVIFSGKLSFLSFYLDFERENSGIVVKKGLRLQKNNWAKWFYASNDLILDIVMSHRTNFIGFWLKVLNRDVNTAFSVSR